MILTLSAKNKLPFVTGDLPKPAKNSSDLKAWERCNALVCSQLIFNLDDAIAKSVLFLTSAAAIWKNLEERFGYSSMTQVYSLEQKLSEISQGNNSVTEFYTNIKTIWDVLNDAHPLTICTCNKCSCNLTKRIYKRQQEKMLLQFMMKLNEQFSTVRGNVLMLEPVPNISQAYRSE